MEVKVYDFELNFKHQYIVHPDIQLYRYIINLYPKSNIIIRLLDENVCIDVYIKDKFVERHLKMYTT